MDPRDHRIPCLSLPSAPDTPHPARRAGRNLAGALPPAEYRSGLGRGDRVFYRRARDRAGSPHAERGAGRPPRLLLARGAVGTGARAAVRAAGRGAEQPEWEVGNVDEDHAEAPAGPADPTAISDWRGGG